MVGKLWLGGQNVEVETLRAARWSAVRRDVIKLPPDVAERSKHELGKVNGSAPCRARTSGAWPGTLPGPCGRPCGGPTPQLLPLFFRARDVYIGKGALGVAGTSETRACFCFFACW